MHTYIRRVSLQNRFESILIFCDAISIIVHSNETLSHSIMHSISWPLYHHTLDEKNIYIHIIQV